jgi:hypothetical protein
MESLAKKTISRLSLSLFFAFFLCAPSAPAPENGLALTPPMGWNSWNRFACHVTEDLGKSTASFATKVPSHGVAMLRIIP